MGLLRERLGGLGVPATDGPASRVEVVLAGAPFASTSYGRARLLRQLHATGVLDLQARQAADVLGVATC